jgi:AraC family transcriptional regulator
LVRMNATTLLTRPELSVVDYRCTAGPTDTPFVERHRGFDIAFVRKGSFGYRAQRRVFELVAGSFLIGRPFDEYSCTHDHHAGGDECLAFHLSEAFVDEIAGAQRTFSARAVLPLSELVVVGELAQAAADGRSEVGLDEAGALLARRFVEVVSGERVMGRSPLLAERRRAVTAALWIEAHSREPLGLADAAREAGLSVFHFLRTFSNLDRRFAPERAQSIDLGDGR